MRHLDSLGGTMLIMLEKHVQEIKTLIEFLRQNDFLSPEDTQKYLEECSNVLSKTDYELDNMGIDQIRRDRQYGLFVQIVGAPIIILGTLAVGIKELALAIGSIFKFKEKEKLQNFRK